MLTAERTLRKATRAIREELETKLYSTALAKSLVHPGKLVAACSAMGVWDLTVEDAKDYRGYRDIDAPVFRTFERVLSDYGWGCIPAPVYMEFRDGSLIKKLYEW